MLMDPFLLHFRVPQIQDSTKKYLPILETPYNVVGYHNNVKKGNNA